ncbi:MAG: TonB-dependent receptor, partial [Bacteroidota bacterium]
FSYIGYEDLNQEVTVEAGEEVELNVRLNEGATMLNTATVTSGKFEKPLSEVTVSLEVLKPSLVESTNTTSIETVLEKVPGVTIVDGQANIRGGSGFSYGAGSRVLLLMDDIPILQADAGFPNWADVPVENLSQIEVVKGAASALYGSSALNGIINVRTAYAKSDPEFKASLFHTTFLSPQDSEKQWWRNAPFTTGGSMTYKRKIGKLDLVVGSFALREQSFRERTTDEYKRMNVHARYRITDNLSVGFNSNFNQGNASSYFYYLNSDSGAFMATPSALSRTERLRYNIDPYLTYYDPVGNRHKVMGRFYSVDNMADNAQSNSSRLSYGEYQFQRNFKKIDLVLTAGGVIIGTNVQAELYGDTTYTSLNQAAYIQLDKEFFGRLNLSAGFRYESNRIDNPGFAFFDGAKGDSSRLVVIDPSVDTDARPVFRFGANLRITDYTFLRASWGQGYRFPTIAEKYIVTDFGGATIGPNPDLQSETGWSTEVGIKQGFKLGAFNGYLDIAGFWTEYQNMMEFTLTRFLPPPIQFQSLNVGGTEIKGIDVTVAGQGDLFGSLKTSLLAGYTFIDPRFLEFDTTPATSLDELTEGQRNAVNSSVDYNILKYRSRHTFKFDLESKYKRVSVGVAVIYASFVEAVDNVFENLLVPGLGDYRMENNTGATVFSVRMAYHHNSKTRISLLLNNLLNEEYTVRPGLLEAPRNIGVRLDYGF